MRPDDMKVYYHGSSASGMKIIEPRKSTHGEYVYAAKDKALSIAFMKNIKKSHGDFSYWKGRNPDTGKIAIAERYAGAFADIYGGISGSIYALPADSFVENKTGFNEEVLSEVPVVPIEEIKISNVWDYLIEMRDKGEIEIYFYPDRPKVVPQDDGDLVERAKKWSKHNPETLKTFNRLHPALYNKEFLTK
jgi:hypothetical protein